MKRYCWLMRMLFCCMVFVSIDSFAMVRSVRLLTSGYPWLKNAALWQSTLNRYFTELQGSMIRPSGSHVEIQVDGSDRQPIDFIESISFDKIEADGMPAGSRPYGLLSDWPNLFDDPRFRRTNPADTREILLDWPVDYFNNTHVRLGGLGEGRVVRGATVFLIAGLLAGMLSGHSGSEKICELGSLLGNNCFALSDIDSDERRRKRDTLFTHDFITIFERAVAESEAARAVMLAALLPDWSQFYGFMPAGEIRWMVGRMEWEKAKRDIAPIEFHSDKMPYVLKLIRPPVSQVIVR